MGLLPDTFRARLRHPVVPLLFILWLPCRLLADAEAPVYLKAQTIYYDQVTGLSTYRGRVKLRRGDLTVFADKAVVRQKGNDIDTIDAYGAPLVLRKRAEPPRHTTVIRGQRLRYDAGSDTVTVSGEVVTTRGKDVIRSAKLVYRIGENHISAERRAGSAPVIADLWPAALNPAPGNAETRPNQ